MNLANTIIPKSDQLNSDDLISGPRTIKITAVKGASKEQPVSISYEGDNGRPYKPSKSMRRVLIMMWGNEGDVYVTRRLTLYRDETVKFGGEEVGGIKISHASDIGKAMTMALTETRGQKKKHTVEPLVDEAKPAVVLVDLPENWESLTNEERGPNRASLGIDPLKAWWGTLSKADREVLKPKLDGEWKAMGMRCRG